MAQDNAQPGDQRRQRRARLGDGHGDGALAHIQHQGQRRQSLAAGAQHVGGADIARPDLADVAEAGDSAQHQPERDRAQQVAEQRGGGQDGHAARLRQTTIGPLQYLPFASGTQSIVPHDRTAPPHGKTARSRYRRHPRAASTIRAVELVARRPAGAAQRAKPSATSAARTDGPQRAHEIAASPGAPAARGLHLAQTPNARQGRNIRLPNARLGGRFRIEGSAAGSWNRRAAIRFAK